MRERSVLASPRSASRRAAFTVDVAVLTPRGKHLAVLLVRSGDVRVRERWSLPYDTMRSGETLDDVASRIGRAALDGDKLAWLEQVGGFGDGARHPHHAPLSIGYVGVVAQGTAPGTAQAAWFNASEIPALSPRQRAICDDAMAQVRTRMDTAPIAFRMLPTVFTLSELQQTYELLLGRRLHKASFRRALQAAFLVEPMDEWRSEGRGRPAQLFQYAPRKRRANRRAVRFDLLE